MKIIHGIAASLACVVLAVLAAPAPANATSALYFSDSQQARLSTAVVVATIGSSRQELHPQWGRPLTFTTIHVDEVIFGAAPASLEIEQIAGERDGITSRIPGDASFEAGERCVLFLRQVDGGWYLTSLGQSKYELVASPGGLVLHRELRLALFVRDDAGRLHPYQPPPTKPRTLEDLRVELASPAQPGEGDLR